MEELETSHCRVCLQIGEKFMSLYEQLGDLQVFNHIMCFSDVNIAQNDGFPDTICPSCLLELQSAISFKKKCEESDCSLRNFPVENEYKPTIVPYNEIKKEEVELPENDFPEDTAQEPEYYDAADETIEINVLIPKPAKGQQFSPQCNECLQYFRSKCKLRVHWKKEHSKRSYVCENCRRLFKSKASFDKHKKKSTRSCRDIQSAGKVKIFGEGKTRIFKCEQCDYTTNRYIHLRSHFIVHTPGARPFKCKLCPSAYTQRGSLDSHMAEQHASDSRKQQTCHVCGKTLSSQRRLYRHLIVHNKPSFPCPQCKQLFKTKHSLKTHALRHTGIKTYQCEVCSITFFTSAELCNHRKKHNRLTLTCNICEFQTVNKNILKRHIEQHGELKGTPCVQCGKFYESVGKLQNHLRKYHKPKQYQCQTCLRTYTNVKSAKYHMVRAHKASPPYVVTRLSNAESPLSHVHCTKLGLSKSSKQKV